MTRTSLLLLCLTVFLTSCQDDDDPISIIDVPTSYSFERNGNQTVSFDGQTTRIAMAEELVAAFSDPGNSQEDLMNMFRNAGPNDEDVAPFATAELNASDKSIRSKIAASADYFSANATGSTAVRNDFEGWIAGQATEVFPRWNELAAPGEAGQLAVGSRVRYVNAKGLEYNQVFAKSLLGGLMLDQALNNYLSPAVLDAGTNRADNLAATTEDGKPYTSMEHKWDEAYGYLFGQSADPANPLATLGEDDQFLNEYIAAVDADTDFNGIAQTIFDAFLRGRAAIVAGDYGERDRQADIIREHLSRVIAVRGTFYLARGADATETETTRGGGFHALSEAYGFVYSLQFTRKPGTGAPYFSREEVQQLLATLTESSPNGLWDVTHDDIRSVAQLVSDRFGFSFDAAAN
ncbi:hypothetical protein GGR28_000918 [Lewinella aquimaris]|uniref:DUF4856 domain-containing protein n=1 Tax=Neolewinella aquimaris TaxID=1835722 RepID=A0A840E3R0_9BACT|nr:DUF4856 domain-containing protein [Neolewinella aquimaris]MBB4078305.1 hypothetical protein [Neolewinella aquimaris]